MKGRVLIIAGSDSGGGAGIQADIKAVTALGGYAMTAITALTAQDTQTVHGVHLVPPDFVVQQIAAVMCDLGADVIKIGMLGSAEMIEAVAQALDDYAPNLPVILDPVMVTKGGVYILDKGAEQAMTKRLLPRAAVITPNATEAEVLIGGLVRDAQDQNRAAQALLAMGPQAVLLKGGHIEGDILRDLLVTRAGAYYEFTGPRIETTSTHGTGCTLASALATGLAQGLPIHQAVARAHAYVTQAIRTASGFGHGYGPLNHAHTVKPFGVEGA